jgi:hypothetical protein
MALIKSACSFAFQAPAISDLVTIRVSIDSTTLMEQHVVHGTSGTLYASPGETQRHDETWIVACGGSRARWPARDATGARAVAAARGGRSYRDVIF